MKKISILALMVMIGVSLVFINVRASEERTQTHKFKAYTANTSVSQSKTIFRITGVATGNNAVFGIYNIGTLGAADTTNVAVEGGEATSGDALPMYDFGKDGLNLDTGSTIVVSGCTIVLEYI
mgnify:CR=1 FL=1